MDCNALDREAIVVAYTHEDLLFHGAYSVALAARHRTDLWASDEQLWPEETRLRSA